MEMPKKSMDREYIAGYGKIAKSAKVRKIFKLRKIFV